MKKLKWVIINRHIALPLVLVAVVFIIAALIQVRGAKEQGTYAITHVYGDSSVMEGVTISGAIQDANHKTSFIWKDAQVDSVTEVFSNQQKDRVYRYYRGMFRPINDYYYYVYNFVDKGFFVERGTLTGGNWETIDTVVLDIPVKRLSHKNNNNWEFSIEKTYGLTEAKGDIYFTLTTTPKYKGMNGIYKLNFEEWEQKTDPITTFSLDNSQEEGQRTAVLGLESVDDALALILVKDNALVIEGYRTDGDKLGEITLAPFLFEHINAELADEDTSALYEVVYEAYSQQEDGILSLSFNSNQTHRTIVTVQYSAEGIKLADITEIKKEDELLREISNNEHGDRFITYKNGKLYYVGVFHDLRENEDNARYRIAPIRLLVNVYEQGDIVYTGELISDMNDDLLRIDNRDEYYFNYDRAEYRNFYDLYIH